MAETIALAGASKSLDICVYTNRNIVVESIDSITEAIEMTEFSPREIVSELDRFIVGQAMRNGCRDRPAQSVAAVTAGRRDARRFFRRIS